MLRLRSILSTLVIKVENTYAEIPKKQGSSFITSKQDKQAHGWGLKSVKHYASKYDGYVTIKNIRWISILSY